MKQKNILILGLAKSGTASFNLLYNKKDKFYLYDESEAKRNETENLTEQKLNVFILKELDVSILEFINLIVISPSISIFDPFIVKAKRKNIKVISELELGFQNTKNDIIAITGTNGKTTTVSLVNAMFCEAKLPCKLVGNIGTPLCSVVKNTPRRTTYICEVSSFQLEAISKFAPKECGILNITSDHISRHGSFNEYKRTKFKLFSNLKKGAKIVVNSSIINQNYSVFKTLKNLYQVYEFGFKKVEKGCYIEEDNIYFSDGKLLEFVCKISDTNLIGSHNLENIMASICFAKFHKISNKNITNALTKFVPAPHRIQNVYQHSGSTFYDDSKATNIDACLKAVNSFASPIVLILGGSDKGYDFDEIFEKLPNNVISVLATGQVANKISLSANKFSKQVNTFETLKQATEYACQNLQIGQDVLLSPACASFDEFTDYKDRGEKFLSYIKGYYEK